MTMIQGTNAHMSDRQFQAWVNLLYQHHNAEQLARRLRLRLAGELGFDLRRPSDIKVGDTIRPSLYGSWHEVVRIERGHPEEGPAAYTRFYFEPGECLPWIVYDETENDPGLRGVVVAMPQEPF